MGWTQRSQRFPYFGMSSWRHHSAPGRPSYLLLLEVQELHRAHLSVGLPAGSSFSPPAAPAAIGLVGEAADPILAGGSGAYRLRGGFNHHDLLAGPEERGGRKVEAEKRDRAAPPCWHPDCCPRARSVVSLHPVLAEITALQKNKYFFFKRGKKKKKSSRKIKCGAGGCRQSHELSPRHCQTGVPRPLGNCCAFWLSPCLTETLQAANFSQNQEFQNVLLGKDRSGKVAEFRCGRKPSTWSLRCAFRPENLDDLHRAPAEHLNSGTQHPPSLLQPLAAAFVSLELRFPQIRALGRHTTFLHPGLLSLSTVP